MTRSEYSEEIAAWIDAQVRETLHCYRAKEVLQENRTLMDCLVDLLSGE